MLGSLVGCLDEELFNATPLSLMPDTKRILSEFRKAINSQAKSQVVDLDLAFFEKFEVVALRLQDVFRINTSVPPNKWSFHRIGIITQGTGEFQTGLYKIPAKKNTLVVVPARVMTASRKWTPDVEGLLLLFNSNFLLRQSFPFKLVHSKKILQPFIKPYVYLNDKQARHLINIFESILTEQSQRLDHCEEIISLKVFEMIIQCERLFAENGNLSNEISVNDVVTSFSRLLEQHFHEHHSVSYYAMKLNFHPNYLNSLIKKYTGETVKAAINNRLLIETKYLLHSTSLSIKEIASRIGFERASYLTSFFRRNENISPAAYRLSTNNQQPTSG
jgi:AraC family transcriptional regulator, transcriptional activator of pobA